MTRRFCREYTMQDYDDQPNIKVTQRKDEPSAARCGCAVQTGLYSPGDREGRYSMSISKYNSEGYHDPTTHDALTTIERDAREAQLLFLAQNVPGYRSIVFICSPYAGDVLGNERRARRFCRFAVEKNCIPIAPHLLFPQFLDDSDPEERALGLFMGCVLLTKCAELWVFGEHVTDGMALEIEKAERRLIPIRYFTEEMEEMSN